MGAHPIIPILSFSLMISAHDFGYACDRHLGFHRARKRMIVRTMRDDPHTSIFHTSISVIAASSKLPCDTAHQHLTSMSYDLSNG
jgi:hypothetical protein